jgi:hypothetical protein
VSATKAIEKDQQHARSGAQNMGARAIIEGTLAQTYLAKRGIVLGPHLRAWPSCIKFVADCPRGKARQPALVSLVTDIASNEPLGIIRRFLHPDGTQDGKAENLGSNAGGVVKLCPDDEVTMGLGLCEGVETGMSLMTIGWRPLWATGGTGGLAEFPLLGGIECLSIFADNDANEAGMNAATACARRYRDTGCDVRIILPRVIGSDFNDAFRVAS